MAVPSLAELANAPDTPVLKLPYPYFTPYFINFSSQTHEKRKLYQITSTQSQTPSHVDHQALHTENLHFGDLQWLDSSKRPSESINSPWGRAMRCPSTIVSWTGDDSPSVAQLWLVTYVLFTVRPDIESFRLQLHGNGRDELAQGLIDVALAIRCPSNPTSSSSADSPELQVLRSNFWQGAGSPFGPRPVWSPDPRPSASKPLAYFPLSPLDHTLTVRDEGIPVRAWHPRRPVKPTPGSVIYSRYVPHLKETFSMVALDYQNSEHLNLFHEWQNDPRVSQGWNETGTIDQHREYLRRAHEDPHQLTVLAQFDDVHFAYFEIYWAKEDHLGTYYDAEDFDRGRHSLVGDIRFRGPHRVGAWWSSLMHYLYLDDPRTKFVVGEPKATNSTVLLYDFIHGFSIDKFVDLPHKRSGFMRCSRERFFQLCPLAEHEKTVGGTGVLLSAKL